MTKISEKSSLQYFRHRLKVGGHDSWKVMGFDNETAHFRVYKRIIRISKRGPSLYL